MSLIQALGALTLTHTCREQKRVAHLQAKEGDTGEVFETPQVLIVPPIYATLDVEAYILGTIFLRKLVACNSKVCSLVNIHLNMGAAPEPSILSVNS